MEGLVESKKSSRTKQSQETTLWEIRQNISESGKTHPIEKLLQNEKIENSRQDRDLKKKLASWFIWILVGQLLMMNVVFILSGFKWLIYSQWVLELYMTGTLAQVFGIVLVMTKNLFPVKKV